MREVTDWENGGFEKRKNRRGLNPTGRKKILRDALKFLSPMGEEVAPDVDEGEFGFH